MIPVILVIGRLMESRQLSRGGFDYYKGKCTFIKLILRRFVRILKGGIGSEVVWTGLWFLWEKV